MELDVRDWMIIIGVLLIIAVLLDGYRRVRNERRGNIRMSLNKQFLNAGDPVEEHSSELPNGGARTVGRRATPRSETCVDRDPLFNDGPAFGDGQLDFDQTVPMLMESVASENTVLEDALEPVEQQPAEQPRQTDQPVQHDIAEQPSYAEPEPEPKPARNRSARTNVAQEVVVINVVARDEPFKGPDLLHILLACDLRFGHMNIFHRYEQANGSGAVQFSMANSVEPGTFDLDTIDDFTTPGVCFFMSVPGPDEPGKAFEFMVETAQCLVSNLNGEMLDESRSAMTNQTLEHCRQRIQEFERRQLAQHA